MTESTKPADNPPDDQIIQTDYEIGQDNVLVFGLDIHNPVFVISGSVIILFVLLSLIFQDASGAVFSATQAWLTTTFDWVFMTAANIFVLFCLFLLVSPLGKVRLGGPDATPDWSYFSWFAMLFAAGMGIGLVFFGVLEPVNHFQNPPLGVSAENTEAARQLGIASTIFHWGLHPWAIYAVVGLALAFFSFNAGLPLTIRSAFYPLFGDRVWGWLGHVIDTLAVFATLFGLATSLGFGASQATAGLNYLWGVPNTITTQVILILLITAAALVSVLRGMDGGVRRLSELNMILAGLLLLFVIIVGGAGSILVSIFSSTVGYVTNVIPLSNPVGREDTEFMHAWTTFYWAWWISWSPFVGMFIARVSRGRTVREFIACVLLIPTVAGIVWMNAFGGVAIDQFLDQGYTGVTETISNWTPELSLFAMLEPLPLASITSFLGIVLVTVFFVTSSDSGSLVIDSITAGGKVDAPVAQRAFWAVFEGLVAIALLVGGGLAALQAASVTTGFPFALVLLLMCVSLYMGLRKAAQQT